MEPYCRICGYTHGIEFPMWLSEEEPSDNICSCCGAQTGYVDSLLDGVRSYRAAWMKNGCKWWNEEFKPANWNVFEQMKNIPEKWI